MSCKVPEEMIGAHVRRDVTQGNGSGAGAVTHIQCPVVRHGFYWRVLGVGLEHNSGATQALSAYMLPEMANPAATLEVGVPIIDNMGDHVQSWPADQLWGGPTHAIIPPGWRLTYRGSNLASGDTLKGVCAFLELPIVSVG